jgi:hypothetical protein
LWRAVKSEERDVEHCREEQEDKVIAVHDAGGRLPVPCATLGLLVLGPTTAAQSSESGKQGVRT